MTLDRTQIRALCFDIDGTLSDTDDQFVENLVRFFSPLRFINPDYDPRPLARKIVMKTETPGNYIFGMTDRLGLDQVITTISDYVYRKGLGKSDKQFLIIPGIEEMLASLQSRYKMAVVSARRERSSRLFIDQFDLSHYFDCIATAQTCKYTKPYPDPILWAAEEMGVAPNECLMIGDTTVDILAAVAAGAQSVGVLCGFGEEDELIKAGANYILETTSMLPEIL
jgi:phosphoglycolate phosphatase-like HAD superfamily hydrolase